MPYLCNVGPSFEVQHTCIHMVTPTCRYLGLCTSPCRLRESGIPTPDIAAWHKLPGLPEQFVASKLRYRAFYHILKIYNWPDYDRMCA